MICWKYQRIVKNIGLDSMRFFVYIYFACSVGTWNRSIVCIWLLNLKFIPKKKRREEMKLLLLHLWAILTNYDVCITTIINIIWWNITYVDLYSSQNFFCVAFRWFALFSLESRIKWTSAKLTKTLWIDLLPYMVVDGQGHSAVFPKKKKRNHVVSVPTAYCLCYFFLSFFLMLLVNLRSGGGVDV